MVANPMDVLIVGAGPTGLILALFLVKQGVRVRIIDKMSMSAETSRATVVHARTLELYRLAGLTEKCLAQGQPAKASNIWVAGAIKGRVPLAEVGKGLTPYPFLFVLPQDIHERILNEEAERCGINVERNTELLNLTDHGTHVTAELRMPDGGKETCTTSYIAGCDGARSAVRNALNMEFVGDAYHHLFYVADIEGSGPCMNNETHMNLDEADIIGVFPYDKPGHCRLIGMVHDERVDRPEALTLDSVGSRAIDQLNMHIDKVNWFSTYRVHHRVAEHFAQGRAFLVGDAAHIHSPAGGQGMNTGIGDAINLSWKLASVIHGKATADLLPSYETERRAFALKLVQTTDRVFTTLTAESVVAGIVRRRVAPLIVPLVLSIGRAREFFFRAVSQIGINYRSTLLSEGATGDVHGGDRLPWVADANGSDNFASFDDRIGWQVHVYGLAKGILREWCGSTNVQLHEYEWHQDQYQRTGLVRDAAYLIRPDTYIAVADLVGDAKAFEEYAERNRLVFSGVAGS
ncbi:2-polyprenyl-6-methoxyphenol hydroxylase-like oxidoreductase [Eremomyces bilateralis CBS 781.70]|uniref:2-polyprenyl-6-methoxyphenol hydroxylase-like oxidoreductase n=1 Tax=Eremomyces bilateralis CBS 781.70 TaxID=1392243 RepID=A0A6G1GC80_9PEZI|nr:2-polyprenyl-6-methoxyphenol hydroxylase-like oxidoreductase [Eremomyces bilateralis CBS 781.70]KAF1815708.1 2-polyprenyl-6-methoxyphenol hydroxylase-like oxidoreductase [Eremomyces bilateralis CBS 781.70]